MKCETVAAKSDLQTVIDEHYVGVRESADGEPVAPPKPVKKGSIFKVFIREPAQDSPGASQTDERRDVCFYCYYYFFSRKCVLCDSLESFSLFL